MTRDKIKNDEQIRVLISSKPIEYLIAFLLFYDYHQSDLVKYNIF